MATARIDHVLVIPDGNRRQARREFLRDRLRESPAAFDAALDGVDPEVARAVRERIEGYAASGADAALASDRADVLDQVALRAPRAYLLAAYRASAAVLDALIRDCLATGWPRVLSIYAMQPSNLLRSDDEVHAFVRAETEAQERWADDAPLCAAARFGFVGDRALLEPDRQRPALRGILRDYLASARRLESAACGDRLRVHLLAPYEFSWELDRAVAGGHFDPAKLAIPDEVDLVIRSGGLGRSLGSGALPVQTAFSRHAVVAPYFPDCEAAQLRRVIEEAAHADVRRGL
jgi:undecaprenyl pyrophosphate synthase